MKTVLQAIKDEIYYPINAGLVENKLMLRGLSPEDEYSLGIAQSDAFKGALADSLLTLVQAASISEADKSIGVLTDAQRKALLQQINKLYASIGEEEVAFEPKPTVYINC